MRSMFLALVAALFGAALALADDAPPAPAAPDSPPASPPVAPEPPDAPAAADADPWRDVAVVALHDAAARGLVDATGSQPNSYRRVKLRIRNRSKGRVAVDLAGSHVEPRRRGTCQRLGIGPAVTPSGTRKRKPGTLIVELEPGAESSLEVNTCCLDGGLPCPPDDAVFEAATSVLPPVRENVLRWWVDHPDVPQSAVNQAIWRFSAEVRVAPGVVDSYAAPVGRFAALHRGVYYRLVDGELTATDADGVVRLVGSEVFQVLPTDFGLYVVALGDDRKPKLWLVPMTAEGGWKKVLDLDERMRPVDLHAAPKGNLALVTDQGVWWHDEARNETTKPLDAARFLDLSVRRAGDDRLVATMRLPEHSPTRHVGQDRLSASLRHEVWEISLLNGKAECVDKHWNVGAMLAGPAGVFALTHTQGRLKRLVGEKLADLGPDTAWGRIVSVAEDVLWLTDADDRLVAVDAKSGAVRCRSDVRDQKELVADTDPISGDLAWIFDGQFRWTSAKDGTTTTLLAR